MKLAFRIVFITLFLFPSLGFADSVKQVKPMTYEQESEFIATYKSWLQKNGKDFRPALVWAAAEGEKWFVEMLLRHNEKIDEEEKAGGNALSAAILNEQEEIVELLLSKGADPHKTYANQMKGVKPIILAAQAGNTKILTRLIEAGTDVNYVVPDKYQSTPLYIALFHNRLKAAEVLIKSGAVFRPYRYPGGTIPERVRNQACALKRVYEKTFKEVQCK